jgi:hypothetical protein
VEDLKMAVVERSFAEFAPARDAATPAGDDPAASRSKPYATALAGLTAAAIAGAVVPALAGLAFLISLATRRPMIGTAARRWPWLTSYLPARNRGTAHLWRRLLGSGRIRPAPSRCCSPTRRALARPAGRTGMA